jgi:hypothetical protein
MLMGKIPRCDTQQDTDNKDNNFTSGKKLCLSIWNKNEMFSTTTLSEALSHISTDTMKQKAITSTPWL